MTTHFCSNSDGLSMDNKAALELFLYTKPKLESRYSFLPSNSTFHAKGVGRLGNPGL